MNPIDARNVVIWAAGFVACGGVSRQSMPAANRGAGGDSGAAVASSEAGTPYITSCRPDCGPHGGTPSGAGNGGGSGVAGMAGAAQQPARPVSEVWPSSGCGKLAPTEQVATVPGMRTGFTEYHVQQTGESLGFAQPQNAGARQFFVRVPTDYDVNRPYRVVYTSGGCAAGTSGDQSSPALFDEQLGGSEQAVYVALSAPSNSESGCFDTQSGPSSQEWEAFELVHSFVESTFCVDNNRIFAAGYESGGALASMWGCYFGGTPSPPLDDYDRTAGLSERKFSPRWAIRGQLVADSSPPTNEPKPCNGPAAGLWLHGQLGVNTPIDVAAAELELALKTNGCTGNFADGPKEPWAPASVEPLAYDANCQRYTGCPDAVLHDYPLVFCTLPISRGQSVALKPLATAFMNQLDAQVR